MKPNVVLSKHALEKLAARGITTDEVMEIIGSPLLVTKEDGLHVYHGLKTEDTKPFLIRIFINENVNPNLVVTAYKTSKIRKYYEGKI